MVPVKVQTYVNGKLEKEKTIDHDDPRDRVWLAKHCWWAARNGAEVRSIADGKERLRCSNLTRIIEIKPDKHDEHFDKTGDKFEKM